MTPHFVPAIGPKPPTGTPPVLDLAVRMSGAATTVEWLVTYGLKVHLEPDDCELAGEVTLSYAQNPVDASKAMTDKRMAQMTPAALRAIDHQLRTFSHNIVQDAQQVRTFVTNKLLEETENPDPRIRIKALELLGKISDVGLFAEKSEVTVTHKTSDELRDSLRAKLSKLVDVTPSCEDAEIVETPLTAETLDAAWDER
jgi:hypothetical protein